MRESTQLEGRWWERSGWGGALILLATVLVYLPLRQAGFIWDDDTLLTDNPFVKASDGLRHIWLSTRLPDYFPLTLTSFWLEWRLWGMWATGYHFTNVVLHGLSAVLLWRVLRRLKVGWGWWAGLVFAVHPVNVESVAWIVERKNTLSMVFYLLTVLCYLRYEQAGSETGRSQSRRWYGLALGCFLMALLSKTAPVMLPVVLLGFAWWQRGRVSWQDVWRALPFFVLALVLGLVTVWFQSHRAISGTMMREEGFWTRLAAAGWAVWFYLYKAVIPADLMFVYPRWEINPTSVLAYVPGLAWVACLVLFWRYRNGWGRAPLFALGYFVVMLLPVLGFVDVYFQLYSLVADHWQYFAIIGVIGLEAGLMARVYTWLTGVRRWGMVCIGAVMVFLLGWQSWRQAGIYRDNETLWRDTLAKNPACWLAHGVLGIALYQPGRVPEALWHMEQVLLLRPDDAQAHYNWAKAMIREGRLDEAIAHFREAVRLDPGCAAGHYGWGYTLQLQGKFDEAIARYAETVKLQPDHAEAHYNWGNALVLQGKQEEARTHFEEALRQKPDYVEALNNLGNLLVLQGKLDQALEQYRKALNIKPDYAEAHYYLSGALARLKRTADAKTHLNLALKIKPSFAAAANDLAWLLATATDPAIRNVEEAVRYAERACELTTNSVAIYLDTLGVAYSEAGRFTEAVQVAGLATVRAMAAGDKNLAEQIRTRLEHYQTGRAYRSIAEGTGR